MGNVKDYFSGNFLKAEDCKGGEVVEILEEGKMQPLDSQDPESKKVMNYKVSVNGVEKQFSPNKGNGAIMIEAWGEDDKAWIGKKFLVKIEKIRAFGKKVNSIVVDPVVEETETEVAQKK